MKWIKRENEYYNLDRCYVIEILGSRYKWDVYGNFTDIDSKVMLNPISFKSKDDAEDWIELEIGWRI